MKKWLITGLGWEMYKMNPRFLIVQESKDAKTNGVMSKQLSSKFEVSLNSIRWDDMRIKMNKNCHGLKQTKYIKIHAFTTIFKKEEMKKTKLIGQCWELLG